MKALVERVNYDTYCSDCEMNVACDRVTIIFEKPIEVEGKTIYGTHLKVTECGCQTKVTLIYNQEEAQQIAKEIEENLGKEITTETTLKEYFKAEIEPELIELIKTQIKARELEQKLLELKEHIWQTEGIKERLT